MERVPAQERAVELTKRYRSRHTALSNQLAEYTPLWTDVRNFLAPRTARFPGEQVDSANRQDLNIINTSPRFAVRTLGAGMQSGVTSPLRPWFRLAFSDKKLSEWGPVKNWLYEVQEIMFSTLAGSNFYDRVKSNYVVLGAYGTSGFGIEEDPIDIIRCRDFPMGSFMIATDESYRVNTMYRNVKFTSAQMVERFKKKTPYQARVAYDKGNYDEKFDVIHIIEPNAFWNMQSDLTEDKQIASVYMSPSQSGEDAILAYKGYDLMPVMAPRWEVLGEDTYGTGCGDVALGDAKGVQLMEKRSYQILDKYANPNMLADASMRNQRTTNLPGETNYVNGLITGNAGYRPSYTIQNPVFDKLDAKTQRVEQRIDEAFFKNLFLQVTEIADQPNITATQINALREEKLLMLGPVLERLNDEFLGPLIDFLFYVLQKRGMLPPAPKEIQGMPIKIEYISVLAQAQKAMGLGNIERVIGFVSNLAQQQMAAGIPVTAWDNIDTDESIRQYSEGTAIPAAIIRGQDGVAEIREGRAQQQAAAQQMQMAQAGADTAKTMSETSTEGGNVLARALDAAGVGL